MPDPRRSATRAEPTKLWALYVRVSDQKQLEGREYHSLESQETFLREWVRAKGGAAYRVYSDTESGTKMEQRQEFMALLADARAGRFQAAVAYNADRWCRSLDIHTQLKRVEQQTGVRFLSATQEFGDDPEGEFLEGNIAVVNQYYSRIISKKVKIKRRLRAERGEWNGGRRPFGYTSERGRLIVTPEEAAVVRQIFDLYCEHPSATTVRNRLRALGIKDRRGECWSNSSIEAIIRNPVYGGLVRSPDGDPVPGIHEAILPREAWERARALVPTRKRLLTKTKRVYPLVGLLHCGACDAAMTSHYVKKPDGRIFPRYRCSKTFHRGWRDCPVKEVNAKDIEQWVLDQIRQLGAEGSMLDAAIAQANTADEDRARPLREEEARLNERVAEVRTKISRLMDAIADGGSGFQSVRARLTLEERNVRLLEEEQARLRAEINRLRGEPLDPARLRHVLANFDTLYAVASAAERKELLQLLIRRIVFRGEGQEVTLEFYSDVNLKGGGSILRATWLRRRDSNSRPGG